MRAGDNSPMRYKELLRNVLHIAEQIEASKKQAMKLGIFTHDRDILSCKRCGLYEDVEASGLLIVTRGRGKKDTGLRFLPVGRSGEYFQCPSCHSKIKADFW